MPQTPRTISDAEIDAAAEEMWNDRDARHGGVFSSRDPREVVIIQTKATARGALEAAERVRCDKLDGCQFCYGAKGGTPGNENRLRGVIVCDFCVVLIDKAEGVRSRRLPLSIESRRVEDAIVLLDEYASAHEEQTFGPHDDQKGAVKAAVETLAHSLAHPLKEASEDQLRLNLRRLIGYARWQIEECASYHPTLPSAVSAARGALGDVPMVSQTSIVTDAMFHAADEARNAALREDPNDQIGALIAALEAAIGTPT